MKKLHTTLLLTVVTAVSIIFAGCVPGTSPTPEPPAPAPAPAPAPTTPTTNEPFPDKWVFQGSQPITGAYAFSSKQIIWGMDWATQKINAMGGIRGLQVETIWHDHFTEDAAKSIEVMSEILDTKPLIIFGPGDFTAINSSLPMAIEDGVYCIHDMTGEASGRPYRPWALSLINGDETVSWAAMYAWLDKEPGMTKVVQFVCPTNPVWMSFAGHQADALEANGIEVVDVEVPSGTVSFGPIAVRALGEDPDGILFSIGPGDIAQTIIELYRRGWTDNSKNMLFECAPYPELFEIGEGYLDDCYVWTFYNPSSESPIWQDMLAAFHDEYGDDVDPSFCIYSGWAELSLTKQCFEELEITGDPARLTEERLAIKDYMNNCTYESVFGPMDIVNGVQQDPVFLFIIENNKLANPEECPLIEGH